MDGNGALTSQFRIVTKPSHIAPCQQKKHLGKPESDADAHTPLASAVARKLAAGSAVAAAAVGRPAPGPVLVLGPVRIAPAPGAWHPGARTLHPAAVASYADAADAALL